jgi:hypothetical protein
LIDSGFENEADRSILKLSLLKELFSYPFKLFY